MRDPIFASAGEMARALREGEVSSAGLVETCLERIAKVNPTLNAVVTRHYELAREAVARGLPDGPLRGVPYLLKDLGIALAGTVTTQGSVFFRESRSTTRSTTRYPNRRISSGGKPNESAGYSNASSVSFNTVIRGDPEADRCRAPMGHSLQ